MRHLSLLALAFAATVAALPVAQAEIKTHPTAKVQIDVPTGWKMNGNQNLMTVADPTDEVGLILMVVDAPDLQKAVGGLDAELAKVAKDFKWEKKEPAPLKLNGMDALGNQGTATVDGKPAAVGLLLVKTPTNKLLLVLAGVDADKKAAHKEEITRLLNSIKPAP